MTYYVGMMSGTSLDGIDAVLAKQHSDGHWSFVAHADSQLPDTLRRTLLHLNHPSHHNDQGELHAAIAAEKHLTRCYAKTFQQLISEQSISPDCIAAIGAHGQTIRHEPNADTPYTLQLLDGALLSHLTDCTVVSDFRSRDIAAGGQGAPLAPIFHQALFQIPLPFAVVNIGGISNISLISEKTISGFDCGPGNCLLDEWIDKHQNKHFDKDGQWAAQGNLSQPLLSRLLSDSYFSQPPPKSTGRDYFHVDWLTHYLDALSETLSAVDIMRTLVALTAKNIADSIPQEIETVVVAGGGAKNPLLLEDIKRFSHAANVLSSDELGIAPQHLEALGFALLAQKTLNRHAVDTRHITGASQAVILGAIHPSISL